MIEYLCKDNRISFNLILIKIRIKKIDFTKMLKTLKNLKIKLEL